jgi:hypothetical protein
MMTVLSVDQRCNPPQQASGKPFTIYVPSHATLPDFHTFMDPLCNSLE